MSLLRSVILVLATGLLLTGCESSDTSSSAAPQMAIATGISPASFETEKDRHKRMAWADAVDGLRFENERVVIEAPVAVDDLEAAAAHLLSGEQSLMRNHRTDAVRWFRLAAQAAPGTAEPFYQLGRAFITKGKTELSQAAFATALDRDADHQAARIELAGTYARQSNLIEAIEVMTVVTDLDPACGAAHQRLAVWNYYAGNHDAAMVHVERAAALGTPAPPQLVALLRRNEP